MTYLFTQVAECYWHQHIKRHKTPVGWIDEKSADIPPVTPKHSPEDNVLVNSPTPVGVLRSGKTG